MGTQILLLFLFPFLSSAQQMYQDLPRWEEFPIKNGINRQIFDLEKAHDYQFALNLAQRRRKIDDWGIILKRLVAEAQTFCRHPIALNEKSSETQKGFEVDMKLLEVQIIDGFKHYKTFIDGDDFVGYQHRKEIKGMRPLTIKVKHTGCVDLPYGCYAETSVHAWFAHYSDEVRWARLTLNLATKPYTTHCSLVKRIFNFWPFYHLF